MKPTSLVHLARLTAALQDCFSRRTCRPMASLPDDLDLERVVARWAERLHQRESTVMVFWSSSPHQGGLYAVQVVPSPRDPFVIRYASTERLREAGIQFPF
ncbi:MAG: hypothetical protein HOP09_14530 [Hyphomicrobium sp.]|nr:hypothetical protein [Hyphomicrobium sp.]